LRQTHLLPLLLATALACSGPNATSSPASPTTATATASPAPTTATPAPPAFPDLVRLGAGAAYKATYKLSGNANGQRVEMDQTIYNRLPRTRVDVVIPSGPAAGASSMFMLENGNYMCVEAGRGKSCLRLPDSPNTAARENPANLLGNQPGRFEAHETGGRQIAGRSARCFDVTPPFDSTWRSAVLCFSTDGIPLLTAVTSATDAVTMEATSVATVSDADFTLPGPVVEGSGGAGAAGLPTR